MSEAPKAQRLYLKTTLARDDFAHVSIMAKREGISLAAFTEDAVLTLADDVDEGGDWITTLDWLRDTPAARSAVIEWAMQMMTTGSARKGI